MMIESVVPLSFWYLACATAVFLANRSITTAVSNFRTPCEVWFFRKPSISHLRVFGCKAYRHIRKETRHSKFEPVSSEGVLIGYDQDNFNYLIYALTSRNVVMSHDVTFEEDVYPMKKIIDQNAPTTPSKKTQVKTSYFDEEEETEEPHLSSNTLPRPVISSPRDNSEVTPLSESVRETQDPQPCAEDVTEDPRPDEQLNPPRTSSRLRTKQVSYRGMCNVAELFSEKTFFDCLPEAFSSACVPPFDEVPKSLKSAKSMYDGSEWMKACEKEIESLSRKNVWVLTERPTHKKFIRGMWLFKRKILASGGIKHKARYVAMGNTQVEGEDYGETFAPTGKPSSLRLIVAVAAIKGWEIHQMDAVTAFLNSLLHDEVYVEQPPVFVNPEFPNHVWMLTKSLYGLKQSPKLWKDDVKLFLKRIGFHQCEIDPCTYIRSIESSDKFTAVYVHVDDLAITGNDIQKFKKEICSKWEMDDLGLAHTVVGIKIKRLNTHKYSMTQSKFAETILTRFNMNNSKPASTPLSPYSKLYKSTKSELEDEASNPSPYRNAVGSLMYLAQCTRTDLAHAVGVLSQHLETPSRLHWDAVTHVLRYLNGTSHLGIIFNASSSKKVKGHESFEFPTLHCDADWAGDKNTRRSTTGYVFMLAGGALSWKSRLQPTVALFSTEAEYCAVTEAGQELLWLQTMMKMFGFEDKSPTLLHRNNLGAIHLTSKSIFHGRTKHIETQ